MKRHGSSRGFGRGLFVGLLAGLVLGSSAMVLAAPTGKGWTRFTEDFRFGYVFGFLDMANLARNLEPGGYVDEHYPLWPKVNPMEWKTMVDELYRNPENQKYSMTGILQLAALNLEKKYGPAPSIVERIKPQLAGMLKAAEERKAEAAAKAKAEGKPDPEAAKVAAKAAEKAATKATTEKAAATEEAGTSDDNAGRRKKFCNKRCPCPEETKAADSAEAPKSPPAPAKDK
jgi:hypothetical protein